jgi:twitching motility two-component system response regulator PilG
MTPPIEGRLRDGIAAARAQRLDDARALLQQAVDADPDNPLAWFWLAVVASNAEAAASHLRRVIALEPSHVAAREALAKLLVAQADRMREAACRLYREAAAIGPHDVTIWRAVLQLAGTPGEALAAVRDVLAVAPDFPEGRTFLHDALSADARAHAAAGDRAAARERWHEVTTLDDRNIEAWIGLATSTDDEAQAQHARARISTLVDDASASRSTGAAAREDACAEANASTGHVARPSLAPASRVVMVVDDSPTIRKILSLTLEDAGYSVIAEADGESALERLADVLPDVILLDIAMPGIDGYETCKRIRVDSRTTHLPILMLSGKDALFDKVKGHMAGATEYLTKPFEAATVLAAVGSACSEPA